MKLLRAKIDGFGRYAEQTFEFGDGLNVVYGKNEAGKSTLQQFLLAMLYGMKKPGRKRAVYLEEEAKYRPWQASAYGGVLWIEAEGVVYRIERSLRREDEWVRIYRQDSGEEVTGRFQVDSRKEVLFAQELLQADREQFVHTLCIGPVDERERVMRLRESVRHGDGGSGDLLSTPEQSQVRQAEEALQKRLEALGTERASTKSLGMAVKKRDDLHRSYQAAWAREESQKEARASAEQVSTEWHEAQRDEQELREQLRSRLARYLRVQQAKRGELLGRIALLERALADARQEQQPEIDEAAFREMQQEYQRLLTLKHEYESYQKRLDLLETESREANAMAARYKDLTESAMLEVDHNAYLLELYEQKAQQEQADPFDPEELEALTAKRRGQKRKMVISGVLALAVIPFCFSQWWAIGLFVALLAFAIVSYASSQRAREEMERWEEARQDHEAQEAAQLTEQERVEQKLLQLLADFHVETPRQYRQKWTQLVKSREQAAIYHKQSQWLLGEVNRSKSEHDQMARRLHRRLYDGDSQQRGLDMATLKQEMERWQQFVIETRERREQTFVWEREQDSLQHELQTLEQELARWQEVAAPLQVAAEVPTLFTETERGVEVTGADLARLHQSWQAAERILLGLNTTYAEANTRYQTMREGQQPAADLLLLKEQADAHLRQIQEERDALAIATELWQEVKEEMYQAVAPRFTSSLAEVTERLTQGRYGEVYLDREESITTISPDSGYTVDLSALSEGTIDQITFALGLALSGWAIPGGEQLPLLLDEPFRRYDDDRLDAVLHVLIEEAYRRQILLFTCREQEVERLQARGGNGVTLVELAPSKYGMIRMDK